MPPPDARPPVVVVSESASRPYGQIVSSGRHVHGADEPEALGGQDTGMSPYQYLLAALGACTSMTIRMYANQHGIALDHVAVELTHSRVSAGPNQGVRDRFVRVITLTGALKAAERQRLLEIAGRCPVSQTLARGSEVTASLA